MENIVHITFVQSVQKTTLQIFAVTLDKEAKTGECLVLINVRRQKHLID